MDQVISPDVYKGGKYFTLPRLLNYDVAYENTPNSIVLNSLIDGKDIGAVIEYLCDQSVEDSPMYASCECQNLHGNYHKGNICGDCHTEVKLPLSNAIRNEVWLEIPAQVGPILHPEVFKMLSKWMKNDSNRTSVLESILNLKVEMAPEIQAIIPGQGFSYFRENFWYIFDAVARHLPKKSKKDTDIMRLFLRMNEDRIWCTKLPILSKVLQPITQQSSTTKLVDENVNKILGVIIDISDILLVDDIMAFSVRHIERQFFNVYAEYTNYVFILLKEKLNPKKGHLRKHLYGTRLHLSFRSVIVPITTPHYGDELYLPWKVGLSVLQYHILSVLVNRYRHSVDAAYNKIWTGMNKYDYELDKIMQLLIDECPYKGLPVVFNRNPSIRFESLPVLFVTRVKPSMKKAPGHSIGEETINAKESYTGRPIVDMNPDINELNKIDRLIKDETIAISPLISGGPNFDFDGDEMNGILLCEMDEVKKFLALHPKEWTISTDDMEVGHAGVAIPNQLFCLLNGYISDS